MEEVEELNLIMDLPTHLEEEEEVAQNHRQDSPQEVLVPLVRSQDFQMEGLAHPVLLQDSRSVHHHHPDLPHSVLQEVDFPGCCWELQESQLEVVYRSNQRIHTSDVGECYYYKDFFCHPLLQ